jgi:hypothetical protein
MVDAQIVELETIIAAKICMSTIVRTTFVWEDVANE